MPVVTMPNGDLVQFPDTMSREQIGQFIASKFPGVYDAPEPSLGTIFTDSLARGGENVAATLKDDLPAYLASILGQDEYAVAQIEEGRARRQAAAEQYPTQYGSYKDVDSIGDAAGFITEKFAENVPILSGLGISALTGAVAAPILGATAATGVTLGSVLGSYSLMAPESFAGIYAETGKLEPAAASIAGAVNSALELVAPVQLVRSFSPSMRKAVVEAALKKSGMAPSIAANAAKGVVKGVATEGLTEGAQESVNIAAESFVSENPNIFTEENIARVLESTVAGAAVGLPLGGVGGTGRGFRERGQFARERRAQEQAEADQLAAETVAEEPVVAEEAAVLTPKNEGVWRKDGIELEVDSSLNPIVDENGVPKVKAVINEAGVVVTDETSLAKARDKLIAEGTFKLDGTQSTDGIPEPTVVGKKPPNVEETATVTGAGEAVIDEELATRGSQKPKTQDDIPVDRPMWSKDLLGFLTDEYEFTDEELKQVQNFSEPEMRDFLAEVEAQDNLVFDGPLVQEEMIVPQEPAEQPVETAVAPEDDGAGRVKDPEQAKIVFDELGVNEAETFNLTDEGFDTLVRTAQAQRAEKTTAPKEKTLEEWFAERDEAFAKQRAELDARKEQLNKEAQERAQIELDKIRTAAPQDKPAADKAAADAPAAPVAPTAKKAAPATKKKPPEVKKFVEDKLAFRNKPLPDKVYQELAALKAATSPQEEATDGRQVLANYLHAYSTPEGAIAAIAAESNAGYTVLENKKLAANLADVQKARTYINNNMGAPVKKAFKANEDLVATELASIKRRNAKEKKDAEVRKVSKFGRSKAAEDLKDVGAGTKGAKAVAKKKKEEIGETPEQVAKRIKDEEKARLDEEAEATAELEIEAEQEGTVGYVAAVIRNAQTIAEKAEAELGPASRNSAWVTFVASLPKTKQKTFLDSYTRIAKENPNLIPESIRARVLTENNKILSQRDKKRAIKFGEKFLLETPEYQGPDLAPETVELVSEGDLQGAVKAVIAARNKRGDDKAITNLIARINSKLGRTSVALDGPGIRTQNLDPLPAEALEVQEGVEGKTAVEAAKFIAKNAPSKDLRVIAAAIQNRLSAYEKAGMPVDFKVIHLGDKIPANMRDARGFMDPNIPFADGLAGKPIVPKPLVRVMGADITGKVGTSYEVVTHELYHAVTSLQINNVGGLNNDKTNAAVAELTAVRNHVVDLYNARLEAGQKLAPIEKEFSKGRNNFLENPREFITWAMTNRGATEYLDSIPYQNTTALTAFVRALRKLFGLETTQDTALTELIKVTEVLLGKKAVAAAMRTAQKVEGAGYSATTLPNMASGAYIPGLNTVVLKTTTGLNEHTLLHESGHAALAQVLNDRNHPTTKKFIEFFDEIKTRMGDAYGGRDLQEFAAEFVGNGEFQALLKEIKAPKSENMFARILQTIAEFFGLRKSDTAYNKTLKFLNDLLDVSQDVEPSLAETLYLGSGKVDEVMDDISKSFLDRNTDDALNRLSRVKDDKMRIRALGTASLGNMQNMFGETSPRYKNKNPLPIGRLLAAIERKRGEVNTAIDRTSKNIRTMSKAEREATAAQRLAFNKLAIDARLEGIDIFKPEPKNAAGKAKYKQLTNRYNNLPQGLQDAYRSLRKELDGFLKEYVELITKVLPASAASNLMKDFAQLEGVTAYVPFERDGEYWIDYLDPDNLTAEGKPKRTPRAFASPRERTQVIKELRAKHGSNFEIDQYDNLSSMKVPKGLPEGQFVTKLVSEMRNNNVDASIIEQVYQQYVSMFPERSLMQQFKKSMNLPGMDANIITAYSNVSIKWANKIANTRYNPEIETAMDEIRRVAKEYHGGNKNMTAAAKALTMQEDFFLNPRFAPWAANLTFASYLEYIVGSISSATVNLTGLLFMVTPMLGARTTYIKATDALLEAGGAAASKNWREGKMVGKLSKYKALYAELDNRGLLQHTVAREALERGKTKAKDFDGTFYKTVEAFSIPFAASEKYMRGTTAIAAYELAMKNGIPADNVPAGNQQAAIEFAVKMTRDAHTGGMAETMPRFMQNEIGRVIWTFKNIVFQQAYVLGTAMQQAFMDSDLPPEVKRAALRQVLGTYGLSFAFLGAKGLPFFGATTTLMSVFNWLFSPLFGDDEEEVYDPRMEMNDFFGDFMYNGALGSVLNVNISSRAALANDILWRDDPKAIEDYGYVRQAMFLLGGPMASYAVGVERALTEDFPAGRYLRGWENMSPTFIRNGLKSYRYMLEGARNRDGDPIDTDINAWNLATQAIGFTPADLSNTYEQRSAAKNFENKILARKQRILNKYKAAKKMGDSQAQQEAVREAREFRRQFPTLMDENTLERSWKASVRVDREDTMAGITFTKGLRYMTDEFFE